MPSIVVLKEKIVPFSKTLFMGGGTVGGHSEKFNVFGGVRKKMAQVRKIPPAPRDFKNERSLIFKVSVLDAYKGGACKDD